MISRWTIGLLVTGTAVAVGTFAGTVASRPASAPASSVDEATEALLTWLKASDAQRAELRGHDAGFAGDLKTLREDLATKRAGLAAVLENADALPQTVRARLDEVLTAQAAVERRVADYLLSVRSHLTADQRRQLFGLCAEGVRQGRGWQWGRRQHGDVASQPEGRGRRGGGRGQGGGRGWGGPGPHN